MPTVIRDLPFFDTVTTVRVGGRSWQVKGDQIVVWISLGEKRAAECSPEAPKLPAILDLGCNHNLLIHEQHLTQWAGLHPQFLRRVSRAVVNDRQVNVVAANAWLHPNQPGERDTFADRSPYLLALLPGIAVVPSVVGEPVYPRLPLLGLRAIRVAGLFVAVDGRRQRVTIRTRRPFFG